MLKIQVLGSGMIPRGLGIAPRLEPFKADFSLLGTILGTAGLEVNYFNPATGKFEKLTKKNFRRVWDAYSNYKEDVKPVETKPADHVVNYNNTAPEVHHVEAPVVQQPMAVEQPKVETTNTPIEPATTEAKVDTKVEDKVEQKQSNDNNGQKNNNGYNNQKKH